MISALAPAFRRTRRFHLVQTWAGKAAMAHRSLIHTDKRHAGGSVPPSNFFTGCLITPPDTCLMSGLDWCARHWWCLIAIIMICWSIPSVIASMDLGGSRACSANSFHNQTYGFCWMLRLKHCKKENRKCRWRNPSASGRLTANKSSVFPTGRSSMHRSHWTKS